MDLAVSRDPVPTIDFANKQRSDRVHVRYCARVACSGQARSRNCWYQLGLQHLAADAVWRSQAERIWKRERRRGSEGVCPGQDDTHQHVSTSARDTITNCADIASQERARKAYEVENDGRCD